MNEQIREAMGQVTQLRPPVAWTLVALFVALALGTLVRLVALRAPLEMAKSRTDSLKSWWVLAALLAVAVLSGLIGAAVLFAAASCLAIWEYVRLVRAPPGNRLVLATLFAAAALNYVWIAIGWEKLFLVFVPLCAFLLVTAELVLRGKPEGSVRTAARLEWGLLLLVYCVSHAVLLFTLPESAPSTAAGSTAAGAGAFLFLIVVTESNDIAQALVGRRFGKHPITPGLSPHKTWEGFVGGVGISVALSFVLTPLLTEVSLPLSLDELWRPLLLSSIAGALIAVSGFLGDVTMSAVKRDAGVKDSGGLLPGQGGILDRLDSLTLSAPVFYYFRVWMG